MISLLNESPIDLKIINNKLDVIFRIYQRNKIKTYCTFFSNWVSLIQKKSIVKVNYYYACDKQALLNWNIYFFSG